MSEKFVTINSIEYLRRVEMLGDVQKINYFLVNKIDEDDNLDEYHEIFGEEAEELEFMYEKLCTAEFTPKLFFI